MKTAPLAIPEDVLKQHVVVFGKTGAGKSSVLRHIVEHLLSQGKRVCVIDPKGDWWGLPSSANGKRAGFPVVLFGDFKNDRSDVPMDCNAGKEVAQIISSSDQPCVLGFRGWMPSELTRFWLDFAPMLFNKNRGELYIVIDEVHNFAPKGKIMSPDSAKMLHWTNRLASEGRGLGLKLLIASQRPQKVHNDTASCCETLIAMRVVHPRDRAAIKDWIDENASDAQGARVLSALPQMNVGEGWVWFPDGNFLQQVKFPMFRTLDSFSEHATAAPTAWAKVDVEAVRAKLARVVKEKEDNDPKRLLVLNQKLSQENGKLENRITMLMQEVHALQQQPECTETLSADEFEQLCDIRRNLEKVIELAPLLEKLTTINLPTLAGKRKLAPLPTHERTAPSPPGAKWQPISTPIPPPAPRRPAAESNGSLTEMQRRILTVLAEHPEGLTKTQILIHADYRSSGPVSGCFAQLTRDGWMEPGGNGFVITAGGRAAVGPIQPLPKGFNLRQLIMAGNKLTTMEKALLQVAFDVYPNCISKGAILERANYKSSGPVSAAFAKLNRICYLISTGKSNVKASATFFES